MPFINRSPLEYQVNTSSSLRRCSFNRAPTVADYKQYKVSDEWLDTSSNDWWKLCYRDQTQGIWRKMCGTAGAAETFIPDAGVSPVVPDAANEITLVGGVGLTTTGGLNTMDWALDVPVTVPLGGTGLTTLAIHSLMVGNAAAAVTMLATGTAGQMLSSGGAGADPTWTTSTFPLTCAIGDVIYGSALNVFSNLAFDATATRYLTNTGGGATIPAWDQVELTNGVSGILPVPNGGTGVATITDGALIVGSGGAAVTDLGAMVDGDLCIGSTGVDPVIGQLTAPAAGITIASGAGTITFDLADDLAAVEGMATTGIVSRTAADTWTATTITQHAVLIGDAGEIPANLGPLTNGQLVIGSTGVAPVAAALSAGAGIGIGVAAGSITITNLGAGAAWTTISASQNLAVDNGYLCIGGAALSLALPGTSAVGQEIEVILSGSTSWTITMAGGQSIRYGNVSTSAGGTLVSTAQGDRVRLICDIANTHWVAASYGSSLTST